MPEYQSVPETLRVLRTRAGLSVREMASQLGYRSGSGYQAYEERERSDLSFAMIRKVATALVGKGDPPIQVEELIPLIGRHLPFNTPYEKALVHDLFGVPPSEAIRAAAQVLPTAVTEMPVVGAVQASFWMPSAPSIDAPVEHLPIPFVPSFPYEEQYALKVVGPSMNKVVQEGQYIICIRLGGGAKRFAHNSIVHVERERWGEVEWTLKRARWGPEGFELWPESTDPAYQTPIALTDDPDAEVKVRVIGLAMGVYAPLG